MVDDALLSRICVVLVETSHPGNVGAVARAMKTMGIGDLRLVRPRFADVLVHDEAVAFASGATDVLQAAKVYLTLPQALHDVGLGFALSARKRTLSPVVLHNPQEAAVRALQALAVDRGFAGDGLFVQPRVAFVFGSERVGLSNEDVLCCQAQVTVECNPNYSSLNLAQAVQIVCYALRCEASKKTVAGGVGVDTAAFDSAALGQGVSLQAVEGLRMHWLQAMEAVGFFKEKSSDKLALRLARLLAKVPFEKEEIDLLRGFLREVVERENLRK